MSARGCRHRPGRPVRVRGRVVRPCKVCGRPCGRPARDAGHVAPVVAVVVVAVAAVVAAVAGAAGARVTRDDAGQMRDAGPALRACVTEDDAGPCYWDAAARGNGRGVSFVAPGDPAAVPLPDPGYVLTSSGRVVRIGGDVDGCTFLTYAEQGFPDAGDPGDGELFCP